jgi:hypothetical protein
VVDVFEVAPRELFHSDEVCLFDVIEEVAASSVLSSEQRLSIDFSGAVG